MRMPLHSPSSLTLVRVRNLGRNTAVAAGPMAAHAWCRKVNLSYRSWMVALGDSDIWDRLHRLYCGCNACQAQSTAAIPTFTGDSGPILSLTCEQHAGDFFLMVEAFLGLPTVICHQQDVGARHSDLVSKVYACCTDKQVSYLVHLPPVPTLPCAMYV